MAIITAENVKALRELSGAGVMDCKRALEEADGDLDCQVPYQALELIGTSHEVRLAVDLDEDADLAAGVDVA